MRDFLFDELNRTRRDAKPLKEEKGNPHCQALDEIEAVQGWSSWLVLVGAAKQATGGREQQKGSPPERAVYFVHDDEADDRLVRYYCELRNAFEAAKHCESMHWSETWRQAVASSAMWCKLPLNTRSQHRRPDAAAYLSQSDNDMPYPPVPLPRPIRTDAIGLFYQWPNEQEWWPDAAGDVARVVALALCFPDSSNDIEVACEHLCVAAAEEWRALEHACEDFLAPLR